MVVFVEFIWTHSLLENDILYFCTEQKIMFHNFEFSWMYSKIYDTHFYRPIIIISSNLKTKPKKHWEIFCNISIVIYPLLCIDSRYSHWILDIILSDSCFYAQKKYYTVFFALSIHTLYFNGKFYIVAVSIVFFFFFFFVNENNML